MNETNINQNEQQLLGYDVNGNPIYGYDIKPTESQPQQQYSQPYQPQPQQVQQAYIPQQQNQYMPTHPQYAQAQSPIQLNNMQGANNQLNLDLMKQVNTIESDLTSIKENMQKREVLLRNSPAVIDIVRNMNILESGAIANFGSATANTINQVSDNLLSQARNSDSKGTSKVLKELNSIMKEFDIDEISKEPNAIMKIFGVSSLKKIFTKYDSMGDKIERVTVELAKHKENIAQDVAQLNALYKANKEYQQNLENYIVAGSIILEELNRMYGEAVKVANETNLTEDIDKANLLKLSSDIMNKKLLDLRASETISFESMALINQLNQSNLYLYITLNSTLDSALPTFKLALCQAINERKNKAIKKDIDSVKDSQERLLKYVSKSVSNTNIELVKNMGEAYIGTKALEEVANNIIEGSKAVAQAQETVAIDREKNIKQLQEIKAKMIQQNNSRNKEIESSKENFEQLASSFNNNNNII